MTVSESEGPLGRRREDKDSGDRGLFPLLRVLGLGNDC